jgi:hypothetical protein
MAPLIAAMLPMLSNTAGLFCIAITGFILLYAVDQLLLAPGSRAPRSLLASPRVRRALAFRPGSRFTSTVLGYTTRPGKELVPHLLPLPIALLASTSLLWNCC